MGLSSTVQFLLQMTREENSDSYRSLFGGATDDAITGYESAVVER